MYTRIRLGRANYYHENVIGGPGAFVLQIVNFDTFAETMTTNKFLTEVGQHRVQAPRPWELLFHTASVHQRAKGIIGHFLSYSCPVGGQGSSACAGFNPKRHRPKPFSRRNRCFPKITLFAELCALSRAAGQQLISMVVQ